MAEINFFFSDKEQLSLLKYLEDDHAYFLPCIGYSSPVTKFLSNSENALLLWKKANLTGPVGGIFILWDEIYKYPIEHDSIKKGGHTLYYPAQGDAGPYIEYHPGKIRYEAPTTHISYGGISYYKQYWLSEQRTSIPVPDEIKAKYKQIVSFVKKMCKKVSAKGNRTYWIGPEAMQLLHEGASTNAGELILP